MRYAPSVLIPAAVSVASVSVFTRVLDADAYGLYSVVASAVLILTVVASGWIEQSVLRYLPEYDAAWGPREAGRRVIGATVATCATVLLLAVAAAAVGRGRFGAYERLVIPAALLLTAEASFIALGSVLQSRLRSKTLSALRSVGAVLRFAMALGLLLWFHRDVRWMLIGAALGRGLISLATLIVVARENRAWTPPTLDRAMLSRFAAYGLPMLGWTLSSRVLGVSDRFILDAYQGSAAVGIYSANYTLVTMGFGLLSGPLLTAAHPLIVASWKSGGAQHAPRTIESFSRLYVLALMPVVAALAVCSREVSAILLGEAFRSGHEIIPILVLGIFAWGFSMYGHKGLELSERTDILFVLAAIVAVLNVVLNFVFIPPYGYRAAAGTTLVCALIYPVLVHWVSKRFVPWRVPWGTLLEATVASALAILAGVLVRRAVIGSPSVVVVAVTGITMLATYGGIVWRWELAYRRRKHK
ncbi:MAG TPA: oligosaccharide flippase family protein [Candidatus Krumholzibacteria bacterium]|nr:oligosaccharide flippase family protein [Candidatus Krumholzibacteria bacterium]